jgi:hypothetical protein
MHALVRLLNVPPGMDNEQDTQNDAAEEEENPAERPEEQSGRDWRHQCTQLLPGGRSHHVAPGPQPVPHTASYASHVYPLVGPSASGRAGLRRELIPASAAHQQANHAELSEGVLDTTRDATAVGASRSGYGYSK